MELRSWQKDALPEVLDIIRRGHIVVVSAPTGSGKTMLVLAAAMELDNPLTVFVRSKSQFQVWFRDASKIVPERTVSFLVGQGDACHLAEGSLISPAPCDLCPLNRALKKGPYRAIEVGRPPDMLRGLLVEAAGEGSCAYRTLLSWADESWLLLASYPYLISPNVRRAVERRMSRSLVIVDEAHNLDSAAEEYSMGRKALEAARKQARDKEIKRVASALATLLRNDSGWVVIEKPLELAGYADLVREEAVRLYVAMARREAIRTNYLRLMAEFLSYLSDTRFKLYTGYGRLRLIDPDPASVLSILSSPPAVVLLSATMPPPKYIEKVWGLGKEVELVEGKPGWGRRLELCAPAKGLTTRYKERGERMWDAYSNFVRDVWRKAEKSILVVCPSYRVIEELAGRLMDLPLLVESRGTRADDIEAELRAGRRLVVAVARGKLVEGVEFRSEDGESLLSDIVVAGIPYKQPDSVEEERARRVAKRAGLSDRDVWFFLQLIPAWHAVAQAAGRAIRSERDKARLWLLDERFSKGWWTKRVSELGVF